MASYLPLADYAVIGNLHTAALVGKNGSLDWCCFPRFDSPSVFAALLDRRIGGRFQIAPEPLAGLQFRQIYLPETNVLLTRFLHIDGVGEVTDFMPVNEQKTSDVPQQIVRSVRVTYGSLPFTLQCQPAFHFAQEAHTFCLVPHGASFRGKDLHLGLASPVPLVADGNDGVSARFTLSAGQTLHFLLESSGPDGAVPVPLNEETYQALLRQTLTFWRRWIAQCSYQGHWREQVQRSALVLKLLLYQPTGAFVAAPTTSLPECLGGGKNWDYRYTWIRDAALSMDSLLDLGYVQEAEAMFKWLESRCYECKEVGCLQPVYRVDGGHDLPLVKLPRLEGYAGSRPVQVGNVAATQKQLGIYGELLDAAFLVDQHAPISSDLWKALCLALAWLEEHWRDPDQSIWEEGGAPRPYTFSGAMVWVAFDRALKLAHRRGLPAPTARWADVRAQAHRRVLEKGWSEKLQSFTQTYGLDAPDASALLFGIMKFLDARDPRMLGTMKRIQRELTRDALVYRYHPQEVAKAGIRGGEGAFAACGFWLADALARGGYLEEGRLQLEKMLSYGNAVGLYGEEIGPTGEVLGNFPQAFTHLSLIIA
ncbi:MAG TPA: glycoside hydrolase family 15 protein, partial [Ktedonobacteraceae bacterium]|nr:glycoside hydrolase family 15 protein [Ktedonobacteraceae bacterium]